MAAKKAPPDSALPEVSLETAAILDAPTCPVPDDDGLKGFQELVCMPDPFGPAAEALAHAVNTDLVRLPKGLPAADVAYCVQTFALAGGNAAEWLRAYLAGQP